MCTISPEPHILYHVHSPFDIHQEVVMSSGIHNSARDQEKKVRKFERIKHVPQKQNRENIRKAKLNLARGSVGRFPGRSGTLTNT